MQIVKGKTHGPQRRVIYGPPGVGKSSFACKSEVGCGKVLAISFETDGLEHIGPDRVIAPSTWAASLALCREACEAKGDWDTVVIDTIDSLEQIGAKEICAKAKKESLAEFGYQEGFHTMAAKWREFLFSIQGAKAKGRSVHLVGHVQVASVKDPTLPKDYGKFIAGITKLSWLETHREADAVLFADYERGMADGRAVMSGRRLLHTVSGTGFDAKHRPNIAPVLPLSWVAYEREFRRYERTAAQVLEAIHAKVAALPKGAIDDAAFKAALAEAAQDVERLVKVELVVESKHNSNGSPPAGPPAPGPLPPSAPSPAA